MNELIKIINGFGTELLRLNDNSCIKYRELKNAENRIIDSERFKYYTGKTTPLGTEKHTHGTESVHETEFDYDKNNNIIRFFESGKIFIGYGYGTYIFEGLYDEYNIYDNINPEEHLYKYDERNRLISETINGVSTQYVYDKSGNILVKRDNERTYVFNYRKNKLSSVTTVSDNKVETAVCAYDKKGFPKVYRNYYLNWYTNVRIKEFDDVYFSYDEDGNRIAKNDIVYIYEDDKLIKEYRKEHSIEYIHGINGIIGFKLDNKLYYYIKNPYGDIARIADEADNIVAEYRYDAFGNHKVYNPYFTENNSPEFIGNINPIRYRGYYFDTETNLYLTNTDYFDPEICRYISSNTAFKPELNNQYNN